MPKVSVLIPVYKVEAYIERCARSLFEQTLEDMEFVFVDDASPDDSIRILQETISCYPKRVSQVRICKHDTNKGLTATRNTALKAATGDFIAWCDSDDYVDIEMYGRLYEKAIKEKADVVYSDFFMVYPSCIEYSKTLDENSDKVTFMKQYIAQSWTVLWNMIVDRKLALSHNLYSPYNVTYCEDFHLSVRLFHYAEKVVKVNDALYYYNRTNVSSVMHNLDNRAADDERRVYLDIISFFSENKVLKNYQREMAWRILKNKQDLVLSPQLHHEFMSIYPEAHKYIISCPISFCNRKIKLFMWMLTHGLRQPLLMILGLRKVLGR